MSKHFERNNSESATKLFHCSYQQAAPFKKSDTLHNNSLEGTFDNLLQLNKGFICKKDGPMDGSLFITKGTSKPEN